MNKKIVVIFILFCLLVVSCLSVVSAGVSLVSSYSATAQDAHVQNIHPSSSTLHSGHGSVFTVSASYYLSYVLVNMSNSGSNCLVRAALLSSTYVYLENSSNVVNTTSLTNLPTYATVNFTFSGNTVLSSGVSYVIVIFAETGVVDTNNDFYVLVATGLSSGGRVYYGNTWYHSSYYLMNYYLYGSDDALPTSTPVATQNVQEGGGLVEVPSYYMILLVLFAVVAVLASLYVTFEREQENKGVAMLFVLVGLIIFVVMIVGFFVA